MQVIPTISKVSTNIKDVQVIFEIEGDLNDAAYLAVYLQEWKKTNPQPDGAAFVQFVNSHGYFSIHLKHRPHVSRN